MIPFRRNDDRWCPIIDLEKGIILDWPKDKKANIHYKVCDDGSYLLLDSDKKQVIKKECYVPSILSPLENAYGDYIIMQVNNEGKINGWKSDMIQEFIETDSF